MSTALKRTVTLGDKTMDIRKQLENKVEELESTNRQQQIQIQKLKHQKEKLIVIQHNKDRVIREEEYLLEELKKKHKKEIVDLKNKITELFRRNKNQQEQLQQKNELLDEVRYILTDCNSECHALYLINKIPPPPERSEGD